jgi:hypothetical protein
MINDYHMSIGYVRSTRRGERHTDPIPQCGIVAGSRTTDDGCCASYLLAAAANIYSGLKEIVENAS